MVVKGDDRIRVVGHGRFEDFPGFDGDGFEAALAQDMEAGNLVFRIKRDDPELFHRFSFQVEDEVQELMAGFGAGDFEVEIIAKAGGAVLF